MSQVFSADSVTSATNINVPTTTETTAVTGNFLSPPFQNAKAVILAVFTLGVGAGTASVTIRIRRNPNAENVAVVTVASISVSPGSAVVLPLQAADAPIGPGPVQYAVTVQQAGATGAGTIGEGNITTMLISG